LVIKSSNNIIRGQARRHGAERISCHHAMGSKTKLSIEVHCAELALLLCFSAAMTCEAISYCDLPAMLISDDELQQSAELFSNHYGKWAGTERRVKMSAAKLREQMLFDTSTCSIMQAWHAPDSGVRNLVGHAFVCRFEIPDKVIALHFVVVRPTLFVNKRCVRTSASCFCTHDRTLRFCMQPTTGRSIMDYATCSSLRLA
jgi:hypothetical protein